MGRKGQPRGVRESEEPTAGEGISAQACSEPNLGSPQAATHGQTRQLSAEARVMSFVKRSDPRQRRRGRNSREQKVHRPPAGEPFVCHTREMLESQAWRARSLSCVRLLEFLEIEHMSHAGTENGNLMAPYTQLVAHGLRRHSISAAIEEAELLGLVRCRRGARVAGRPQPSRYRLTYLGTTSDHALPTNEWKRITPEQIAEWHRAHKRRKRTRHAWRQGDLEFLQKKALVRSELKTAKSI
jgi:hypothetical protein